MTTIPVRQPLEELATNGSQFEGSEIRIPMRALFATYQEPNNSTVAQGACFASLARMVERTQSFFYYPVSREFPLYEIVPAWL